MAESIEVGELVVRLGLEDAGLNSSMAALDRQMKVAQSQFERSAAGLDEVADAGTRLQMESDALNNQLTLQGQKIGLLNSQYQELVRTRGADSREAQQMEVRLNNMIRDYQLLQQNLNQVNGELQQQTMIWGRLSQSLSQAGEKLKTAGESMKSAGDSMSTGLTVPLTSLSLMAGKVASDMEGSASKIKAALGATAEEAEGLGGVAKEVWSAGFGDSLEEVNNSIIKVKQQIKGLNEGEVKSLAEDALILQKTFDADVNESVRTASVLMKNFNIDGSRAMDLITVGFQKGGDYSGELLDTLREYGPQFASMGKSADEMLAILIAGAESGAWNLDKIGDSVKEFNIRAQDGSKTTADGFAAIGLNADQMGKAIAAGGSEANAAFQATIAALASMDDPLKQNQAGVALFGTQWEDVRSKVILAMNTSVDQLGEIEGATKKAGNAIQDNFGTRMTKFFREIQQSMEPLGKVLLNMAEQWMPKLSAALSSVSKWFSNLSPGMQTAIVVFGGIVAAIGPVLMLLGSLVTSIGSIITAFSAVSGAIAAAGGVMAILTGPVGIAIGAIAALGAAVYLIYDNWEPISQFFIDLWNGIVTSLVSAWDGIKEFFTSFWGWLQSFFAEWGVVILAVIAPFIGIPLLIQQHWDEIKTYLSSLWDSVKQAANTGWDLIVSTIMAIVTPFVTAAMTIFNSMKDGLMLIWEGVKLYFSGVWEAIKNVFLGAVLLIYDLVTGNFTQLVVDAQQIWTNLQAAFAQIWEGIKLIFSGALEAIKGYVTLAWTTIKSLTETVWNGIRAFLSTVWAGIQTLVTTTWNVIKTTTVTVWNAIKTFLSEAWDKIKWFFTEGLSAAKEAVVNGMKQIKSDFITYMSDTITEIKEFTDDFIEAGEDFVISLWDGIKSKSSWLWKQIKGWIDGLVSQIRGALSGGGSSGSGGNNTGDSSMSGAGGGGSAPGLATGGTVTKSGLTWVGENGPELLHLPRASQVIPNYDIPKVGAQAIDYNALAKAMATYMKPTINQTNTFNSPTPLTPAETARKNLQVSRQLALEWGM